MSTCSGPGLTSLLLSEQDMEGVRACSVAQSCLTLCDPVDCSLSGSFVCGIFQANILEWAGHLLFQGIFPTQGSNLHFLPLLNWQADSSPLSHLGNPDKESGEEAGGSKALHPRSMSQPWHPKAPSVKWASNGVKPHRLL